MRQRYGRNTVNRLVTAILLGLVLVGTACAGTRPAARPEIVPGPGMGAAGPERGGETPTEVLATFHDAFQQGAALSVAQRPSDVSARRFTQAQLWMVLQTPLASGAFQVEEVGRSLQGRPIHTLVWGEGPERVFFWSQMHGDESCATMAIVDLVHWLATDTPDPRRDRLRSGITLILLPMLNPDGAERFQRENAVGIDINRDARRLATPEARILRSVWETWQPDYGFNLPDQDPRTSAGRRGERAAIALLAPAADPRRSWGPIRSRARQVAAVIATVLEEEVPGRVARYGDAFNPRAFGDLMQQWGTSTVLIESGVLPDDPQKQRLRAINSGALLAALEAIARGSWRQADPRAYEDLPENSGNSYDLVVRGGTLLVPGQEPVPIDLAFAFADGIARTGLTLRAVGDLEEVWAHEEIDASGHFLVPAAGMLQQDGDGAWLTTGAPADLVIRVSDMRRARVLWRITPDGVFKPE